MFALFRFFKLVIIIVPIVRQLIRLRRHMQSTGTR